MSVISFYGGWPFGRAGIGQLFTGKMADHFCKKELLFWGMMLQELALIALIFAGTMTHFIVLSSILGWG